MSKLWPRADTNRMEQARRRLGGWRLAILMVGLLSLLMVALPAQAGLGDLLDDLLDPIGDIPVVGDIVDPIVDGVVDPIVDGIVDPIAGDLLDPIADGVLAPVLPPIVEGVVAPIVEEVVAPVVNTVIPPAVPPVIPPVVPPVIEPPLETTTTTAPPAGTSGERPELDRFSSGYPGVVLTSDSSIASPAVSPQATTEFQSLEAALALQTALADSATLSVSGSPAAESTELEVIDTGWLNGLTNWLRNSADGLLDLLGMPFRLLELLGRALLTAGSGLIAPLSMLLAFTAYLIKDRRWGRATAR